MNLTDLKDFYIDLNGDVKAGTDDHNAKFITDTDKLNSEYKLAETEEDIMTQARSILPSYQKTFPNILRQYAVKTDKDGTVKGIKVYAGVIIPAGDLTTVVIGDDISSNGIEKDYYYSGSVDAMKALIQQRGFAYEIQTVENHTPVLCSIKLSVNNEIINFKVYYVTNDRANLFDIGTAKYLSETLSFK